MAVGAVGFDLLQACENLFRQLPWVGVKKRPLSLKGCLGVGAIKTAAEHLIFAFCCEWISFIVVKFTYCNIFYCYMLLFLMGDVIFLAIMRGNGLRMFHQYQYRKEI